MMIGEVVCKVVGFGTAMVQIGCATYLVLDKMVDFVVCSGPSMQSTINPKDVVITEHFSVHKRQIERGDIVISLSPSNPNRRICKRVTGLEGDWIDSSTSSSPHTYIPRGHVWLEGDNQNNSTDSNEYGPVPFSLLRSRVIYKIWPLGDVGWMGRET